MLNGWRRLGRLFLDSKNWLALLVGLATFIFGYLWRLGDLVHGANRDEIATIRSSNNLASVWHHPLNTPYLYLQHLLLQLHMSSLTAARLTSVIFVVTFAGCSYFALKVWLGRPTAIFGCLILLSNPYTLIIGRTATPRILMLWLVVVAAAVSWCLQTERRLFAAWLVLCLVCGLGLFIPGFAWLLLAGLIFVRREMFKIIKALPRTLVASGVLLILGLALPLIVSLATERTSLAAWLMLPDHWPHLSAFMRSVGWTTLALFAKTQKHTDYILGRGPMLGITEVGLVIFGAFALARRLARGLYLLCLFGVIAWLLAIFNQSPQALYFILPIFAALAAIGVRFLYIEWRRVFPLNPLPRVLALSLISAVLAMHILYGLRYALVAWPHNPDVNDAYMLK